MLYLTFDSNIWIYLLDDSWKEYNPLDHLEHWIDEQHIKILLPEIISIEWNKHRDKEKENRQKQIKDFFSMADDILPSAFISIHRTPENIEGIVEEQFNRIDILINTKAEIIPATPELKIKVYEWGVLKKAPMHKKSSVADTIILFSLFAFAESNPQDDYMFISNNTEDFCIKENGNHLIHPDLQLSFKKAKIIYRKTLEHLIHDLKEKLPVTVDLEARKRERIKNKIRDRAFNPALMASLKSAKESYLENISMMDVALKNANPTREQITWVLGLMDEDRSYQSYFLKNVNSVAWFPILKNKGLFSHVHNPAPIEVDKGFHIPFWEPLNYLEKLSIGIENGTNSEIIDDILKIITETSQNPKDNYMTWYNLIKVLAKLPNDKISVDTLYFIPTWLEGHFSNSLQSLAICEKILPKFLNENPTTDDVIKAEVIVKHILETKKIEMQESVLTNDKVNKLVSKTYLNYLSDTLTSPIISPRLAKYLSDVRCIGKTGQ
jgi:hypothetical protein